MLSHDLLIKIFRYCYDSSTWVSIVLTNQYFNSIFNSIKTSQKLSIRFNRSNIHIMIISHNPQKLLLSNNNKNNNKNNSSNNFTMLQTESFTLLELDKIYYQSSTGIGNLGHFQFPKIYLDSVQYQKEEIQIPKDQILIPDLNPKTQYYNQFLTITFDLTKNPIDLPLLIRNIEKSKTKTFQKNWFPCFTIQGNQCIWKLKIEKHGFDLFDSKNIKLDINDFLSNIKNKNKNKNNNQSSRISSMIPLLISSYDIVYQQYFWSINQIKIFN